MSNIIKIKRSTATSAPASLQYGELAYSFLSQKLYIGNTTTGVIAIGGKVYTDYLNHTPGTTTPSAALIVDANSHVSAINTTNLKISTSGGAGPIVTQILTDTGLSAASNTNLATAGAIKAYVDSSAGASSLSALTDTQINAPANANILIYDAGLWRNYSLSGDVTMGQTGNLQISPGVIVDNDISSSAAIARSKLANGTANHVIINAANGALSSEAFLAVSRGGTGTTTAPANGFILIGNGTGYNVSQITGTANQIQVNNGAGSITLSFPSSVTIPNDLTVTGNLTVGGTLTALDVDNVTIEDTLIKLAKNNTTSDLLDIGFYGVYDTTGTQDLYTGIFRDATDGKYRLFTGSQVEPTTTVNISATGYTVATLVANIESPSANITGGSISGVTITSLATDLAVVDGGTGVSAFSQNGVLYGATTSSLGFATGTNFQVLQLNGSGVPTFADLDGGTF